MAGRRLEVGVAKKFLDGADVRTLADELGGEGVAELVGGDPLAE